MNDDLIERLENGQVCSLAQNDCRNRFLMQEAAARIRELEADISDDRKIAAESGRWLGEILAVIHGDGGHHLYENGPEISARDAIEVWYDHTAQIDALEAEVERRTEAAGARVRELEAERDARDKQVREQALKAAASIARRQGLKFTEDAILALAPKD